MISKYNILAEKNRKNILMISFHPTWLREMKEIGFRRFGNPVKLTPLYVELKRFTI